MASIQDRWHKIADGKKVRTSVYGVGKRWQVRYRDPSGKQRTKTFDRQVDADRYRAEVETDKHRGAWIDPRKGETPLNDWIDVWALGFRSSVRASTWAQHESVLTNHVRPAFGRARLVGITQPAVQAWVNQLSAGGLAPGSVRKAYQILGKILAAAVDAEMIMKTPCRGIALPAEHRDEMRFLSPAEVARLARAIDPRYRVLVLVLAYGGLRIGEAAGLRQKDVLPEGRVRISQTLTEVSGHIGFNSPKTKASRREVTLPGPVALELRELVRASPPDPEGLVFTSPEGGPLRLNTWRRRFWEPAVAPARCRKHADEDAPVIGCPKCRQGIQPRPRVHDLRHTAVSLWIATGADPKSVSARAGHTSVSFTLDRYGHLYGDADKKLTSRLEAVYVDG